MQKIFTKAFGAARMEYSTPLDKFETTYHKPGGTIFGALGQMVHRVVDSGRDDTGCGRWSYLTYAAKEGKKVAKVSAYRVCKQTTPGDLTSSKQQLGIMYEDEELRPYLVDMEYHALALSALTRLHTKNGDLNKITKKEILSIMFSVFLVLDNDKMKHDLLMDTFMKCYEKIPTNNKDPFSCLAYRHDIASNTGSNISNSTCSKRMGRGRRAL
jgi:hypothetical protein